MHKSDRPDVALEQFHERPVLAELTELLLLSKADTRYTSCVVVHGMGGTGKVSGLTIILSFAQIGSDCTA